MVQPGNPYGLYRRSMFKAAVHLTESDGIASRQVTGDCHGSLLDVLDGIVFAEDEQCILGRFRSATPATGDHDRRYKTRVVAGEVERGSRTHRMTHHRQTRAVDQGVVAKEIDRRLHVAP